MNKIKLDLEIEHIEMNENTIRRIMRCCTFKPEFQYMSSYKIKLNNDLKDSKCKLKFTNNLSITVQIEPDNTLKFETPWDYNEYNIRNIAEASFTKGIWDSYTLKQFKDVEVQIRKTMDRNTFIDYVVHGCVDEKVMHLTREWHRGIAKTYFIKNMAEKFNLPIFVKYKSPEYNNNKVYTNTDQLIGVRFNKILVDECDKETVVKLRKMGITPIGFACTYQNYELI